MNVTTTELYNSAALGGQGLWVKQRPSVTVQPLKQSQHKKMCLTEKRWWSLHTILLAEMWVQAGFAVVSSDASSQPSRYRCLRYGKPCESLVAHFWLREARLKFPNEFRVTAAGCIAAHSPNQLCKQPKRAPLCHLRVRSGWLSRGAGLRQQQVRFHARLGTTSFCQRQKV